jgi:tRNA threonylcarbamoyladenosine biosynthesis protein TsaE
MQREFITEKAKETQKIGQLLAEEVLRSKFSQAVVICLSGELGAGKTTFTQGLLKGLHAKGPYTSPTFVIMKNYRVTRNAKRGTSKKAIHDTRSTIRDVYHLDAYRVKAEDILSLGWKELIADQNNILIVEWADRIKKIIPNPPAGGAVWIKFKWLDEKKRKIEIN